VSAALRRSGVARRVLLAWAVLGSLVVLAPPPAQAAVPTSRIEGANRFDTAANVSRAAFDRADVVHLVTGLDFPDALAASYAGGVVEGPVLLSAREAVPQRTLDELARLRARRVVLIGGTGTLAPSVEQQLRTGGYEVGRIAGATRFDTAAAVARTYGRQRVGTIQGQRAAVLVSGLAFADALAIGPVAAALDLPLLLTPPQRADSTVTRAVDDLGIRRLVIVGGRAAVSAEVERFYAERGLVVERLAGSSRMGTATVVADAAIERFGFTAARPLLARGNAYPDALAAGVLGGFQGAPILLTATPADLSAPTRGWLAAACPRVGSVRAIGGRGAVSDPVLREAGAAAGAC
jgi:putative cell wall-binding protein